MPKILLTALLLMVVSAAGARYMPSYTYNTIYVVNDSEELLRNVTVEDTRHGTRLDCGDIAPMGSCQLWFGNRSYQKNPLRFSWNQQSEELMLDIPVTLASGPTLRGIITVGNDGSLSTSADQPARR